MQDSRPQKLAVGTDLLALAFQSPSRRGQSRPSDRHRMRSKSSASPDLGVVFRGGGVNLLSQLLALFFFSILVEHFRAASISGILRLCSKAFLVC